MSVFYVETVARHLSLLQISCASGGGWQQSGRFFLGTSYPQTEFCPTRQGLWEPYN